VEEPHLKRDIDQQLLDWKHSKRRKPLILRGARQVGKTWCLKSFGQQYYSQVAYLNFEEMPSASQLFQADLTPRRIVMEISLLLDVNIAPGNTLIILDEIQACSAALNSLKYFFEDANEYHVAAAGSLLGVKLSRPRSFPVGKVNFMDLFPLSFSEFLEAMGKTKLRQYIDNIDRPGTISDPLHEQLIGLLKYYTFTGGMPEVVRHYSETKDLREVRAIQKEVLDAYLLDFAKHAKAHEVMKITTVWKQIHSQLAKENKKFIFSAIRKSARGRDYESAIQWLLDAGLIYKALNLSTPKIPPDAYVRENIFKIYLFDVGLLGALADLPVSVLVEDDRLFTEFKGAVIENLVATILAPKNNKKLYYWSSQNRAEVDFVIPCELDLYPLEVKAGISKKKKSLLVYGEKFKPQQLSRTTLMNLRQDGEIINIPLYLLHRFTSLMR
jgi:uncharacterized protein